MLCTYWSDGYDWRRVEARLNTIGQFRTTIDGLGIHLLHARSSDPDALPLVLTHGWPGSVIEFPRRDRAAERRRLPLCGVGTARLRLERKPAEAGWGVDRISPPGPP
jgi:hypothetical protein